jgi:hypothetical protein
MKAAAAQLAFDLEPDIEPAPPIAPDRVAEALIAAGYCNAYHLSIDRCIGGWEVDAPAPSRLYQFPLEFASRERYGGEQSRLLLNHPDIAGLPFVQQVARTTGIVPVWDAEDEFGRDRGEQGRWYHAVDLMCETHWRHLIETRHLTDDDCISRAVSLALESPRGWDRRSRNAGRIDIATAREVLGILGADEPADRSVALLLGNGIRPSHIVDTCEKTGKVKSERWPTNVWTHGAAGAWMVVHAIEDGWFKRGRDGFMQMSPEGRARRGMA